VDLTKKHFSLLYHIKTLFQKKKKKTFFKTIIKHTVVFCWIFLLKEGRIERHQNKSVQAEWKREKKRIPIFVLLCAYLYAVEVLSLNS
jgi:hypothetical protein